MVIAITRSGYIKRLPVTTYREQRRGGMGVMGMDLKEDDYIEHLFVASTHDYLLFFTNRRQGLPAEGARAAAGLAPVEGPRGRQPAAVPQDEKVRAVIATREFTEAEYLRLRDEEGHGQEDASSRTTTRRSRRTGSSRSSCARTTSSSACATPTATTTSCSSRRKGQAIRFSEKDARPMGRATAGVQGMRLREGDEVIAVGDRVATTPTCSS